MSVLDDFIQQPDRVNLEAMLNACWSWAFPVVDCSLAHQRDPAARDPFHISRCADVVWSLHHDLEDRLTHGLGDSTATGRQFFEKVSDGFLRDWNSIDDQYTAFKNFIVALACFHAVRFARTSADRRRAAEYLLWALTVHLEDGEVADKVCDELAPRWAENPPSDFATAVGFVLKRGSWRASDRRRRWVLARERWSASIGECFERKQAYILDELLGAIYPSTCAVVGRFPNTEGKRLFLWLILGGVSHRRRDARRHGDWLYLVRPGLIDALEERFGPNFIRDEFERPVSQCFDGDEKAYWREVKKRFLAVLKEDGATAEQLAALTGHLGPDPSWGIAMIARAAKGLQPRTRDGGKSLPPANGSSKQPPAGQANKREYLGWKLLLEVGERTLRKLAAGDLPKAKQVAEELDGREDTVAELRERFCPGRLHVRMPKPEDLAGAARCLCQNTENVREWEGVLAAFSGGNKP